jgi:hypothetical protein
MRSASESCPVLLACLALVLGLMSCSNQAISSDRDQGGGAAGTGGPAAIHPEHPGLSSGPRSALAAIRAEWTECRDRAFGPAPLQGCDDRAIDASNALLPRSRAHRQLQELEADLFEPLVHVSTMRGESVMATQATVIYSDAELAQRRATILTGQARASLARERVPWSLANLFERLAGTRTALLRSLGGPRVAQTWLRRWAAIRDEDCRAYPVQQCAALLDGAFRGMLYDNLPDGGQTRLPPLRQGTGYP